MMFGMQRRFLSLQPKLLSCFHSVCSRCSINSGNQMGGNGVVCIVCQEESNLENIIDNEFIKDIQGIAEEDLTNVIYAQLVMTEQLLHHFVQIVEIIFVVLVFRLVLTEGLN